MISNDDRPGPSGATMLNCPINDCLWRYELPIPGAFTETLAGPWSSLDDMVREARTAEMQQTDGVVRAHLATHSVEDYLRTIADLRAQLAAAQQPTTVTVRPDRSAMVRGHRFPVPPVETVTPDSDGTVRSTDGRIIAYVAAPTGAPTKEPR